jgi:CRISPR-associated protein Csd1
MSWIEDLYETYENCKTEIGVIPEGGGVPLLPICHTTQIAHIEVVLTRTGLFKRANLVSKSEARTIIPCTESSGGRTSGPQPHPLCDKLQYVARDYRKWGGGKEPQFKLFESELRKWCESSTSHPKAVAVLNYVTKGTVIGDLVGAGVLLEGRRGKLLPKRPKGEQDVTSSHTILTLADQSDAFVRWVVEVPGDPVSKLWQDHTLWESWIAYYTGAKEERILCYVTGKEALAADQHPAKIRHDADKAKLVSSNDTSGFTFRGRFSLASQAAGVSYEVTQKAHSALRWLLSRQGYREGEQAVVAWSPLGRRIPDPMGDALSILGFEEASDAHDDAASATAQVLALRLKKKIAGYAVELGNTKGVVIMALGSATPGRLAISYFRELPASEFLSGLEHWHESCAWIHEYRFNVETGQPYRCVGAPAPFDIAEAVYTRRIDPRLRAATVERLLPCIIDGRPIPIDLVQSVVRRASHRTAMGRREWEKTLSIACALYRKLNEKEKFDMALDLDRCTRDYLYGRLLAIADRLEEQALYRSKENRETNAARYMQQFADRPNRTWRQIYLALAPYMARLGGANYYKNLIDGVIDMFVSPAEFTSDTPLTGEFLLGYHSQRAELRVGKRKGPAGDESPEVDSENETKDNE